MAFRSHPEKRRSKDAEVGDFSWADVLCGDPSAGHRGLDRLRSGVSFRGKVPILIAGDTGRYPDRELHRQYTNLWNSNSRKSVLIIL